MPEEQLDLIDAALATGKPVIAVLIEGRPLTFGERFDKLDAVVFAGLPGMYGGEAISGVLSGRVNPSGKMSFTYPFKQGHEIGYNHKHMVYSDLNTFKKELARYTIGEFGTGLSYTNFEYKDLSLSADNLTKDGSITATVTVTNTGEIDGKEAVLWYISDEVGTYTRPVKQLKHFEKQLLKAGESKTFSFEIDADDLSYPDGDAKPILEEGFFTLKVGDTSARFELK